MLQVPVMGQVQNVIDFQLFRETTTANIIDDSGRTGTAMLVNLNPHANAWYVLKLTWSDGLEAVYHLENTDPGSQRIVLDPECPKGLVFVRGAERKFYALWAQASDLAAQKDRQPYVPLCDGRVLLRNRTRGHKTSREWATDFLRLYVLGGEQITTLVRGTFYKDAFLSTSDVTAATRSKERLRPSGAPIRPLVDAQYEGHLLIPGDLGIALEETEQGRVLVGRWYRVSGLPGVFLSAIQPRLVAASVIEAQRGQVKPLDEIEDGALVYMVAFDLDRFEMGFALGTEHPAVVWSDRVLPQMRDASLQGPDGFGTIAPLVSTGMVSPVYADRVVATFTGGFKRYHGAFRRSELGTTNRGSHYGFVENGVVLSTLHPGLATVVISVDGSVDIKTWTVRDTVNLKNIRFARQNGVALVEWNDARQAPRAGTHISAGTGNFSGSVDGRYRTLRAGIGLQEADGRRFLLYGYFSSATPSAMARVFQAYGCRYAMLTDMNALEHTYLAVYSRSEGTPVPEHLIRGMNVLDKNSQGQIVPRFVGYADNRDFFYLLTKEAP